MKVLNALVVIILLSTGLHAQTNKGYDIMKINDELKEPKDMTSNGFIEITNKRGSVKTRSMKVFSKKQPAGYDSFFEILKPADVSGMKFLTIAQKGDDDQRMYLPAYGKSRKISGSGKDGKFLGSDIFFYDLEDLDLEDFTYKYIKDETWEGNDYFVVESYPIDPKAPYSKIVNWVRKSDYFIYKADMYDKKQQILLKTSIVKETIIIDGCIEATNSYTVNHKDRSNTTYLISDIKIDTGLDSKIFTMQNLEN